MQIYKKHHCMYFKFCAIQIYAYGARTPNVTATLKQKRETKYLASFR